MQKCQCEENHRREYCVAISPGQASRITSIFAVALAIFQENVECTRSHQAKTFVTHNAWFAHVRTAAEVTPFTVY